MRPWLDTRFATVMLALVLFAAGCGRGAADAEGTGGSGATSADSSPTGPEDAMLAFAQCMRERGVDLPDPKFEEGGGGAMAVQIDPEDEDFLQAEKACEHVMADSVAEARDIDPERMAQMERRMLAFAQCMRGHGIDFPDPQLDRGGAGGFLFGGPEHELPFDPKDREFQQAERACQHELPNFPGHGVGGPAEGRQ